MLAKRISFILSNIIHFAYSMIAMQFSEQVNWDLLDFAVAAALLCRQDWQLILPHEDGAFQIPCIRLIGHPSSLFPNLGRTWSRYFWFTICGKLIRLKLSQVQLTETELLDWLLAGDVSIRYQCKRDLLVNDDLTLRKKISTTGWGKQFLDQRNTNGHWGDRFLSAEMDFNPLYLA